MSIVLVTYVFGCEHGEWTGKGLESFALDPRVFAVACGQDGVEIGDCAARRQDGIAAFVADDFPHLLQCHVLHEDKDGRYLVGEHVGVGRCGEPLAGHRDHVDAIRQLIEEARVTCMTDR